MSGDNKVIDLFEPKCKPECKEHSFLGRKDNVLHLQCKTCSGIKRLMLPSIHYEKATMGKGQRHDLRR